MARMRVVKPSFFTNEILCSLPPLTRLLFEGLWCYADREGRLEDRPRRLKTEILPYDECDVDAMLQTLHETKDHDGEPFIVRYEVAGIRFIQIVKFVRHQTPHCKEAASSIPAQCLHSTNTVLAPLGNGDLSLGNGDLGVGSETRAHSKPPSLETFLAHAKRVGIDAVAAEKCWLHYEVKGWPNGGTKWDLVLKGWHLTDVQRKQDQIAARNGQMPELPVGTAKRRNSTTFGRFDEASNTFIVVEE